MRSKVLRSELLLLAASAIWGFAFVAQRVGMQYVGPFYFNAVRFLLGSLALLPFVLLTHRKGTPTGGSYVLKGGLVAGAVRSHDPKAVSGVTA